MIIKATYRTPAQEHAYLQPEAGVGYIDEEGRVTVQAAGQWAHEDQEQIAHALNLPVDQVRVVYPAIGGAFGGREDLSIQIVLALAALRLHERGIDRPVKIIWSREESILGHHKRHPFVIRAKWGATKEGKITAAEMEVIQDGGAYAYTSTKVLGNATLMCTGPYEIPNVKVDAYSVYTNNIPGGAFRGFGGPQAAFAAEGQINKLAEAGVDFLIAETLPAVPEAKGIAQAMSKTNLPYFISFVINRNGKILDGNTLDHAFNEIDSACENPPTGFMINCAYPSFLNPEEQSNSIFSRLIGYLANASSLDHSELDGAEKLDVEDISDWGNRMIELNKRYSAKILGGCCGTNARHLQYIVDNVGN